MESLGVNDLAEAAVIDNYVEIIALVEIIHRRVLEIVKLELDGLGIRDINNVQAMMLFNVGDAEMTVGELTLRNCYLGSNVSYNVKKMVENVQRQEDGRERISPTGVVAARSSFC